MREREMTTMANLIANLIGKSTRRSLDRIKVHMRRALDIGITREEILEMIMEVYPFSGWPVSVEAIRVAKAVFSA